MNLAKTNRAAIAESVILIGDLSKLSAEERTNYYMRVCESVGLNPLTKPFEYIVLNGRLTLYARKDATDQLRSLHGISVTEMSESDRDGAYIVTVKVQNADGRTDMAKGAVNIANLKGEALANALMKAETKAKRRATLSICGLGVLDETEIETIADAKVINPDTGREVNPNNTAQLKKAGAWDSFLDKLAGFRDALDLDGLRLWYASPEVAARIAAWPPAWRDNAEEEFETIHDAIEMALKQAEAKR